MFSKPKEDSFQFQFGQIVNAVDTLVTEVKGIKDIQNYQFDKEQERDEKRNKELQELKRDFRDFRIKTYIGFALIAGTTKSSEIYDLIAKFLI